MPALRMVASGLTTPLPAISGADPWTGSNIEGKRRSGSRLALAARPMLPTMIAEMSLRISANRFEPTTTSKLSGRRMKFMAAASTSSDSVSMCGYSAATVVEAAVPQHHAVALRVGFGDRGDALLLVALHREIEGEAHDAVDAAPREHGGLNGDLFGLHLVDEAAHLRVLALGVLADHDEIDVAALGPRQRRVHPGIEIGRPHVGVLVEGAPDGQQQAVQRGVVGNLGMAHRAQQDGIAGLEQIDGARRHHAAPAEVVVRAPVEILKRESDVVLLRALFQNAFCLAG